MKMRNEVCQQVYEGLIRDNQKDSTTYLRNQIEQYEQESREYEARLGGRE